MTKSISKSMFYELLDLLPLIDKTAKNVVLLGGTGNGWTPTLAYNPCSSLVIKNQDEALTKISEFTDMHKGKLVIGFLSYELGFQVQNIKPKKRLDFPQAHFLAYENYLQELDGHIKNFGQKIPLSEPPAAQEKNLLSQPFEETMARKQYDAAFDKTQSYIKSGHIYQLNLSHHLRAKSRQSPRRLFSQIAQNNQAAMMGYFESEKFELLSISPERFISIQDGLIKTTPIKGTKPLENNLGQAKTKLLNDPKEKSELSMITDLLRNDLAKISLAGSVKVARHRSTQTLTSLIHTYSEISARLKTDITPIEALLSMFPGGSITGCPKRRAMQIIDELEPNNRGPYCGSLVCITPDGNLDSNILIRTIIKNGDNLVLPVGGGIVFDSDKNKEYQETLDKAQSIIDSLN